TAISTTRELALLYPLTAFLTFLQHIWNSLAASNNSKQQCSLYITTKQQDTYCKNFSSATCSTTNYETTISIYNSNWPSQLQALLTTFSFFASTFFPGTHITIISNNANLLKLIEEVQNTSLHQLSLLD